MNLPPGIPPQQGGPPNLQQMLQGIDPNSLQDERCGTCGSNIKLNATRTRIMPATHPKNPTGKPVSLAQPYTLCIKCVIMGCLEEFRNKHKPTPDIRIKTR